MAAAGKADQPHAGGDADDRILHHDAIAGMHSHVGGVKQKKIGRQFAAAYLARARPAPQLGGVLRSPC
jgi:hypothetical protein